MWLFTTRGFYSVVEHPTKPDRVQVRARFKRHLTSLPRPPGKKRPKITHSQTKDYAWRAIYPKKVWEEVATILMKEITYLNFKEACGYSDSEYHKALFLVWNVMYKLQKGLLDPPAKISSKYFSDFP